MSFSNFFVWFFKAKSANIPKPKNITEAKCVNTSKLCITWVAMLKTEGGQSGHGTLKLTVSKKLTDGMCAVLKNEFMN